MSDLSKLQKSNVTKQFRCQTSQPVVVVAHLTCSLTTNWLKINLQFIYGILMKIFDEEDKLLAICIIT